MSNVVQKLPFDALLSFGAGSGLTATGNATNIIDGAQNTKIDRKTLVIDVQALDRTTGDETLSVVLNYSNSSDMSGSVVKTTYVIPVATSTIGRYTVEVDNEIEGVYYRYSRVSYTLAGTTPIVDIECYYSIVSSI